MVFDLSGDDDSSVAISSIPAAPVVEPNPAFSTFSDAFGWCAALMADSPVAHALWTESADDGWVVGIADLHNGGYHIDRQGRTVILDHFSMNPAAMGRSPYFRHAFLLSFVRALRDIWHEARHDSFEKNFGPEDVLMLERVRAADCDALTVQAAWEMRGAGHAGVWRHLLGMPEGDMAMAFTRYLERDPASLFDGSALAYAFRQWYADDTRVDACDHETLEALDSALQASETSHPFGQQELKPAHIEDLSALPGFPPYLAGLGRTVITDPCFAGLGDPINQSHLFQLTHDMQVTLVNNVPFRDSRLARRIFPGENAVVKSWQ